MGSFRHAHGEHTDAISLFSTAIDAAEAVGFKVGIFSGSVAQINSIHRMCMARP